MTRFAIRSAGLALLTCSAIQAATFPSTFEPMRMNADEGLVFSGSVDNYSFGSQAVALGDINGDGLADIALGSDVLPDDRGIYIVPGSPEIASMPLTPESIAGAGGTYIAGFNEISAIGDFNGDALDDWLLMSTDYNIGTPSRAVIVLGRRDTYPTPLDIDGLETGSSMRLAIDGVSLTSYYYDESSVISNVSPIGDINGDGLSDLAVFTHHASIGDQSSVTIVLGTDEALPATLDLATVPNNWRASIRFAPYMDGAENIWSAFYGKQTTLVDANADGLSDLLFGESGTKYLVFGSTVGLPEMIDFQTLDGNNGTTLLAYDPVTLSDANLRFSESLLYSDPGDTMVDLNGDGTDDLIFTSSESGTYRDLTSVIYVQSGPWPAELNLQNLPESNGRVIDEMAWASNGIGDINADGLEDRYQNVYNRVEVIYGGTNAEFGAVALDGVNGFSISGTVDSAYFNSVTGLKGDFNGDGIDDLLIGNTGGYRPDIDIDTVIDNPYSEGHYFHRPGLAYIIFGRQEAGAPASPWQAHPAMALDSIDLRWALSDSVIAAGFEISSDGRVIGTPGPDERSFEIADAPRFDRQTYELVTIDEAGERSEPLVLSVNNNVETFPVLGGEVYSDTLAEIFWVFENLEYDIYRDGVMVDRLQARSWLDTHYDAEEHVYRIETTNEYPSYHVLRSIPLTLPAQAGTRPPASVSGISFALYSEHTLELFWEPAAWGTPPLSYEVSGYDRPVVTTTGTSLMDYEIERYGGYYYEIVTIDGNGHRSSPAHLSVPVSAALAEIRPARAENLSATALSDTSLLLEWQPSATGTQASGYDIYDYENFLGRTTDTSFTLSGLEPDTIYYSFQIVAYNDDGQRSEINYFSGASTLGGPLAPASAYALAYGPRTAELFWSRVENNATTVTAYEVYRDEELIDTVPSISYMDYLLEPDTEYRYTVYSVSDTGVRSVAFVTASLRTPVN